MITLDLKPVVMYYPPLGRALTDHERVWLPLHLDAEGSTERQDPHCPICCALKAARGEKVA